MLISVITILFFSSQDEVEKATTTNTKNIAQSGPTNPKTKQQKKPVSNQDNGTEKHPPIPADNPIWEWDAKNFVPDFGWFGEHSWMDVRMRVVGHISAAGRDLVRYHVQQGDFIRAKEEAENIISILKNIPKKQTGFSAEIHDILLNGFIRDAQWIGVISDQKINFQPIATGSLALRLLKFQ